MNLSLAWNPTYLPAILGIGVTLLGFIAFWFLSHAARLQHLLRRRFGDKGVTTYGPILHKYIGVLFLGIVPAVVMFTWLPYGWGDYAVQVGDLGYSAGWTIGLSAALILLNWFSSRRPETLAYYPQVRAKVWTPSLIFHNTLAWTLYMLAYEFLFRGLLLFSCLMVLDPWVAIAVNIGLYSATHIPKGFTESMVTIPFGIGMCVLTIYSGAIWIAWLTHVAVALSNDYVALRFNPDMRVQWKS